VVKRGAKTHFFRAPEIRHILKFIFAWFSRFLLEGESFFWRIKCSTLQLKKILRGKDDFEDSAWWMFAGGLRWFGFGAGELL
jgi:hypothetical protein